MTNNNTNAGNQAMTRTFGVELEIVGLDRAQVVAVLNAAGVECFDAGYSHTTSSMWKVVTDISVGCGGCEVVSPVLSGEEGIAQVRTVCQTLTAAGATVNRKCGFHVHVGAADMNVKQIKNVVKAWIKYEDSTDLMVSNSRRQNAYCNSNVKALTYFAYGSDDAENVRICNNAFARIDACTTIDQLRALFAENRYLKLNLEAYYRHRTMEVRVHQGTVDANKAEAWIRFCVGLVETAATKGRVECRKAHGETSEQRLDYAWKMAGLAGSTKRFLRKRVKVLAGQAA